MLNKEILKAISKRELLEDLCFCACRKDHFAGGSSPSLKGKCPGTPFGGFPDTPVPAHDAAKRYSLPSGLVQTSFLTRVRHERLFAIGKRSLSPWANTIALCAELPSDQPTTVDCPSDKLTNFTSYSPFHYVQGFSKSVAQASLSLVPCASSSSLNPIPTPTILITNVIPQ